MAKPQRKRKVRLDARIAGYEAVPSNIREGFTRPGSQNGNK